MTVVAKDPLPPDVLQKMNAYWRAANYLSVGQIYLHDNPLLTPDHRSTSILGAGTPGNDPGLELYLRSSES